MRFLTDSLNQVKELHQRTVKESRDFIVYMSPTEANSHAILRESRRMNLALNMIDWIDKTIQKIELMDKNVAKSHFLNVATTLNRTLINRLSVSLTNEKLVNASQIEFELELYKLVNNFLMNQFDVYEYDIKVW